jgi:nitroreductase
VDDLVIHGGISMDAMEAILSRRSIRRYLPDPLPEDVLRRVLEAGMAAPSAGDERPWHFVVITDKEMLAAIPGFHSLSRFVPNAAAAILVCADPALSKYPPDDWWVQDCSAATQNILLAAHATGLGAVWLGVHPVEKRIDGFRALCRLPESVIPFSLVSLGFPAVRKEGERRFDPSRVHRDRWMPPEGTRAWDGESP